MLYMFDGFLQISSSARSIRRKLPSRNRNRNRIGSPVPEYTFPDKGQITQLQECAVLYNDNIRVSNVFVVLHSIVPLGKIEGNGISSSIRIRWFSKNSGITVVNTLHVQCL